MRTRNDNPIELIGDTPVVGHGQFANGGIPGEKVVSRPWSCSVCSFHNTETLGRFCSMCGSLRNQDESKVDRLHDHARRLSSRAETNGPRSQQHHTRDEEQRRLEKSGQRHGERFQSSCPCAQYNVNRNRLIPSAGAVALGVPIDDTDEQQTCPTPTKPWKLRAVHANSTVTNASSQPARNPRIGPSRNMSVRDCDQWASHTPGDSSLDVSNSLLELIDDRPTPATLNYGKLTTDKTSSQVDPSRRPALAEKDFMMSFANWSISDATDWACAGCTYMNSNPLHLVCEVCGQERPSKTGKSECPQRAVAADEGISNVASPRDPELDEQRRIVAALAKERQQRESQRGPITLEGRQSWPPRLVELTPDTLESNAQVQSLDDEINNLRMRQQLLFDQLRNDSPAFERVCNGL